MHFAFPYVCFVITMISQRIFMCLLRYRYEFSNKDHAPSLSATNTTFARPPILTCCVGGGNDCTIFELVLVEFSSQVTVYSMSTVVGDQYNSAIHYRIIQTVDVTGVG